MSRHLGMKRLMLTCFSQNLNSAATVERIGISSFGSTYTLLPVLNAVMDSQFSSSTSLLPGLLL